MSAAKSNAVPAALHAHVREVEAWMAEAFKTDHASYIKGLRDDKLGTYVAETVRLLDIAKVTTLIAQWRSESTKNSTRGRKHAMDERSALGIMLIQVRLDGMLRLTTMSETIMRMTDAQRESLGIIRHDVDSGYWYDRLSRAVTRLQRLIDPYPGNRRRTPTPAQYRAILAARDPEDCERKRQRFFTLSHALLDASVQFVPRDVRRRFKGNTAIDATRIPMNGWLGGPSNAEPNRPHLSCNYDAGWYVRTGNHDGSASSPKDVRDWAIEAELATMTANKPGESADFPLLVHGISFHKPGQIIGEATQIVESLKDRGYPLKHFIADRAYLPGSKADDLQATLRKLNIRPVFDYKVPERGLSTFQGDVIQVAGQWYVHYMPDDLIHAEALYKETSRKPDATEETRRAAKELRDQNIAERENYRLKPKGGFRPDGSRQYFYPNPKQYSNTAVDRVTGEVIPCITKKTVVIHPGTIPEKDKALKYGQEYPYRSEKWQGHFSLRNTIESQNSFIKNSGTEDIGSPNNRLPRGNTYASLAVTVAVVSANLRKILTFLQTLLANKPRTSKNKNIASTYYSVKNIQTSVGIEAHAAAPPGT